MPLAAESAKTSFQQSASYAVRATIGKVHQPVLRRHQAPRRQRRQPIVTQHKPIPRRLRAQIATVGLLLACATGLCCMGLAYLYGHALVTQEGYRHVHIGAMLRQQRELAQQLRQGQALIQSPRVIEQKAQALGMALADEQGTVTVGQADEQRTATVGQAEGPGRQIDQ
jgi:hypothetical protein